MKTAFLIATTLLTTCLSAQVPRPGRLDLQAVAERTDPGPQPPLYVSLPEPVREWVERVGERRSLEDAVGRLLSPLVPGQTYGSELFASILSDALVVERAVAQGEPDNRAWRQALIRAYGAIASLSNASPESFAGMEDPDTLRHLQWLQTQGSLLAGARLSRTAAEVLRSASDEPAMDQALRSLSAAEIRAENPETALVLVEERMRRRGDRAVPEGWIKLAELYYMTMEFELGDQALQKSRPMRTETLTGSDALESWRDHGERVRVWELGFALRGLQRAAAQEGFAGQLAQARLWSRMGLHRRAVELNEALAQDHPDDARPLIGLVEEAIGAGNLGEARAILSRARVLANKDATYYGASFFLSLMWDLPRLRQLANQGDRKRLEETLRRLLDESARQASFLDEGLGAAMSLIAEFLEAAGEDRMRTYLRELLPRAVEVRERFPNLVPAYTLAIGSAVFHSDEQLAMDTVLADLPERSDRFPQLSLVRATTYLALCYRAGREPVELNRLTDDLARDEGFPFHRELLRGTAAALRGLRSEAEDAWLQAESLLRRSVPPEGMPHRAWALNNLAFAAHRLGRVDEAADLWRQAENAEDPQEGVPTLNRLVANLTRGVEDPEALRELEELVGHEQVRRLVKVQALCRLGLAKEDDNPEAATEFFRRAVTLLDQEESMAGFPELPEDGVIVIGRSTIGLGYRTGIGLRLHFDSTAELWLMLPAPIDEETLREKAAREATPPYTSRA